VFDFCRHGIWYNFQDFRIVTRYTYGWIHYPMRIAFLHLGYVGKLAHLSHPITWHGFLPTNICFLYRCSLTVVNDAVSWDNTHGLGWY
jgi:hypothetical protein